MTIASGRIERNTRLSVAGTKGPAAAATCVSNKWGEEKKRCCLKQLTVHQLKGKETKTSFN
ncbi:hypothetical protein OUZ56_008465 [Daphnia magna]|uniref:Uncharacterized protein n=1 Tax=Daphnia magna TaxID=35525 RepID=A0ABR0AD23_9CRUS|nr:hypothetical protein OUZ56_008465 [Daphnia magna]